MEGARGSLSWTSCQEGEGARVERRRSERKKSQRFRVVSRREVKETVHELFYARPHRPGLITASLLALSFLADGGTPSALMTDLKPLTLSSSSSPDWS